ncbi:hypothetical protein FB567DRAFT_633184 [Paraphoma chrysanthemicola]|uniref:WSC domain-containing protein n=1 Tax=Paraphoma chrysanthemicola TaxID=798071 RepID=A0A8K0QWW2_9PLEO|nr:hypothetical protein FB567DRAFT_633184 [Paraphoma chrysanthemicola]
MVSPTLDRPQVLPKKRSTQCLHEALNTWDSIAFPTLNTVEPAREAFLQIHATDPIPFSDMGRNFRFVLAVLALLRPLGAEVIATPLRAEVIPSDVPIASPVSLLGYRMPAALANLFANNAQHEAGADSLRSAIPGDHFDAVSNQDKTVRSKRIPVGPLPIGPGPSGWDYHGCFTDSGSIKDSINLGFYWHAGAEPVYFAPAAMGADACTASCSLHRRYAFAALKGDICYCFDQEPASGNGQDICKEPCYGNEQEACGGGSEDDVRLTIYQRTPAYDIEPRPWKPEEEGGLGPAPTGWEYVGCYPLEPYGFYAVANGFSIQSATDDNFESSVEQCTTICNENGYWLHAGLHSNGCFCSSFLEITPDTRLNDDYCMAQCPHHGEQACGGVGYRDMFVSVYKQKLENALAPVDPVPNVGDNDWFYKGCYGTAEYIATAPDYADLNTEARAESCIQYCHDQNGYDLAGLLGGGCHCHSSEIFQHRQDLFVPIENCNFKCPGTSTEPCGGSTPPAEGDERPTFMTLYGRTVEETEDSPRPWPIIIPGTIYWELDGCYRSPNIFDTVPFQYRDDSAEVIDMSPEICIDICKRDNNWLYAAAYIDGTCMCTGTLPPESEILEDDSECDIICTPSNWPNELCSGPGEDGVPRVRFWRNALESARTEREEVRP